ncbi:Pleiotropic drug resistance protein ABC Superfamily, partial [Phytophthora palmivora]
MVILMGLLYSSVFYQFDETNAQLVIGVIFNAVMFVSLGQQSQIPTYMAARDIFYKQRRANFFRTSSFVLSNSVSQIPFAFGESLVFGSIVYWMCGYVSSVEAFLLFELMLFMTNLAMAAWFFFLSCISPDLNVANPISVAFIVFFVVFAGFIITKEPIPELLILLQWGNPMAWCVRALAVNQYTDSSFDTCVYNDVDYCANYNMTMGEYSLTTFEVPTEKFWLWYGMVFMAAAYVFFMFLSYKPGSPVGAGRPTGEDLSPHGRSANSDDHGLIRPPRRSPAPGETFVSVTPDSEEHFIPV